MKKKLTALATVTVLALCMSTAVFAAPRRVNAVYGGGYGYRGGCQGGYALMWDANGNFVDENGFEKNLDQAIRDGYIRSEDRDYYTQMYEYCINYGMRGGCRGGMGFYR